MQHLLPGCKMLASSGYLASHNSVFMMIAVAQAKKKYLLYENVKCHPEKWNRVHILENSQAKLFWILRDFEFTLLRTTTSRWPDLLLEEKQTETHLDMWYGMHIGEQYKKKRLEKRTNQGQHPFEIKERRSWFKVKVLLLVINVLVEILKEN